MSSVRAYVLALVLLTLGVVLTIVAYGLPWLSVAVVLGIVATRGWGRVIAAAILFLAGLAAVGVGISLLVTGSASTSVVGLSGGLLLAAVSAWAMVRGRDWPAMGQRYDRSSGPTTTTTSRRAAWDALDRGQDPTDDLVE